MHEHETPHEPWDTKLGNVGYDSEKPPPLRLSAPPPRPHAQNPLSPQRVPPRQVRNARPTFSAMSSKEDTPLVDGAAKKDESFMMKFAAPLALSFYIVVAVVKTMLTKVPAAPCTPCPPSHHLDPPRALTPRILRLHRPSSRAAPPTRSASRRSPPSRRACAWSPSSRSTGVSFRSPRRSTFLVRTPASPSEERPGGERGGGRRGWRVGGASVRPRLVA